MKKIYIALPPRIPAMSFDPKREFPPIERIEVELVNADRILDSVLELITQNREENVDLYGIILPALHYYSLQDHVRHLVVGKGGNPEREGFEIDGVRFFMDPSRDVGQPVPLYEERMATHVYAKRRTTSARCGDGT